MRISEVARPRTGIPTRRVGIRFDDRRRAFTAAMKVWRIGIDVEISESEIWSDVPQPLALPFQQVLERATGSRGFSEWDDARP